jgi:hypothetical protein
MFSDHMATPDFFKRANATMIQGSIHAGMNHAASGFATGIVIGWGGGIVSALTNGAFIGAFSGYLATHDKPAEAAPTSGGSVASCSKRSRRRSLSDFRQGGCCSVDVREMKRDVRGGARKILEDAIGVLAAVVRAHDKCACCGRCVRVEAATSARLLPHRGPGLVRNLVIGRPQGTSVRSGIMVPAAMQQRAERLQMARLDACKFEQRGLAFGVV